MKKHLILFVAILGLALGAVAGPKQAQAITPKNMCHTTGSYCAAPGTTPLTQYISVWVKSTGNWKFQLTPIGTVSGTTFKNKQVDSYYKGLTMYQIVFNANVNYCVGDSGGSVDVETCPGGTGINWVYTPGNVFVNVRQTNASRDGGAHPQVMTAYTAKAGAIQTMDIDSKNIARQQWTFK